MSRPLRIEYTGAWYHIMNRGRRGDNVFKGKEDCEIFVALLKEAAEFWDVGISVKMGTFVNMEPKRRCH